MQDKYDKCMEYPGPRSTVHDLKKSFTNIINLSDTFIYFNFGLILIINIYYDITKVPIYHCILYYILHLSFPSYKKTEANGPTFFNYLSKINCC